MPDTKEIRIPNKLILASLKGKYMKELMMLSIAKLNGHKYDRNLFVDRMHFSKRTNRRHLKSMQERGWIELDNDTIFLRSWKNLNLNKRGGLYLDDEPFDLRRFEALCFAKALKTILRRRGSLRTNKRSSMQIDYPTQYLSKSLGVSEIRFKRLKARAVKHKFIKVTPQFTILGKRSDFKALNRNYKGIPLFKSGKHTVKPEISKIIVLI